MNILSGRKGVGEITGEVSIHGTQSLIDGRLNNSTGAILRQAVAYVPQDEAFFPTQTPEEAIEFVAKLRHGRHGYQQSEIHALLLDVGLGDPALCSRSIGGALMGGLNVPGLSGGEKKRLALACALVLKAKLIMLDEITSGLDSENALIVMERVKQVCQQHNVAAVIVIHQPNGYIFETFDRLILLSNGVTVFSDHVSKLEALYEHHLGCVMPTSKHELPVDLLERSKHVLIPFTARVDTDTRGCPFDASHASFEQTTHSNVSGLWKLRVVLQRNLVNHYIRNYSNVAARLFCYGACTTLCGAINWKVGSVQNPSMVGAFTFLLLASYLLPFCSIPVFTNDKKFFLSERSLGLYNPWIYCVSQTLLEAWVLTLAATVQSIIVIPMAGLWNDEVEDWITFFTFQSGLVASGLAGSTVVFFFLYSPSLPGLGICCLSRLCYDIAWCVRRVCAIPAD